MKYCDIKDFKGLKAYCYKVCDTSVIYTTSPSPLCKFEGDNYLKELHASPSGALGFRLFEKSILWCNVSVLQGIIYSYNTPVGVVINESLLFVPSKQFPFKSATTKKLVTILNRNFMYIELKTLKLILKMLGLNLGWLE